MTDVAVSGAGLLVAAVSVVSSGLQQLLCGAVQRKHKLQSHQLLANTAPVQGAMLIVLGPPIDYLITGSKVTQYAWTPAAAAVLGASCAVAVLVNVSQFMCLGRFSAVTFQVLGHTKTVLVLLISWLALREPMSGRKLLGMALAVAGMVAYGHYNSRAPAGGGGNGGGAGGGGNGAAGGARAGGESLPLLNKQRVTSDGEVLQGGAGGGGEDGGGAIAVDMSRVARGAVVPRNGSKGALA